MDSKIQILPVQEGVAELRQWTELFLRVDNQRVAGDDAVRFGVHDGNEPVGRRLRPDTDARKVLLQQVPDKRGLAGRILTDKHNQGPKNI